ncbi:DUF6717 family protein [Chloroflexota bacterium]
MTNTLMVIEPYWYLDTWVFDDESVGLDKEPFVQGIPEMIDDLVKDIPNAHSGFRLHFSSVPFPNYQLELIRVREDCGGYWYSEKTSLREGWLCPAVFKYFDTSPAVIYIKAETSHSQFHKKLTTETALRERIEELEQMVGKLTLENEQLKKMR